MAVLRAVVGAWCLLLAAAPLAAQGTSVIYALSYQETAESIRARPEKYNIFTATRDQKLMMVRSRSKNVISAVSVTDGTRRALFTDEGPNFEITLPQQSHVIALGGRKAYVLGVEREWRTGASPGVYSTPAAIYEIALDGSNKFRKVVEPQQDEYVSGKLFVDTAAAKLAYVTTVHGKYMLSIYNVATGTLEHAWELRKLIQNHCPDCLDEDIGWLPSGQGLFVTLQLGDDDSISPKSHNVPGTYFVSEEGKELGTVPQDLGKVRVPGFRRDNSFVPSFLGSLPDGSYVFMDFAWKLGSQAKPPAHAVSFLTIANPRTREQKQVMLRAPLLWNHFWISPSGKYVSFAEERVVKNYQSEVHIWSKDLQSGEEKDAVVLPPKASPSAPNVSLTVLGMGEQ
jgi:hypothetical protein